MKTTIGSFMFAAIVMALGCGGGDDKDFSVPDQEASGRVHAMAWTIAGAYAKADPFTSGELSVELHADPDFEPCSTSSPEGDTLFFSVPAEPGRYDLSLSLSGGGRTATFYDGMGSNVIAASGVIEIDEVTAEEISGGINIEADDGNSVAGFFAGSRCPE